MRTIVNISLPEDVAKEVKAVVKRERFASTSEFFRSLLRERFAEGLKEERIAFRKGKYKVLRSLKDLK